MDETEEQLRVVIAAALGPLAGIAERQGANHNVFLAAISPSLTISSKLTRSLTSSLGNVLAQIARRAAEIRYGAANVPSVVFAASVHDRPDAGVAATNDTVIFTQLNEVATRSEATRLLRGARSSSGFRIGGADFRAAFANAIGDLARLEPAPRPWSVRVDLYVADPAVGLVELEFGGELDTSNVKGQPEKLVLAGLALSDVDVPMHFALAYANRGEDRPIAGGLPAYLTLAGPTSAGLLVGKYWWERVLPSGLTFPRFLEIFAEVAVALSIVPEEMRPDRSKVASSPAAAATGRLPLK